MGREIKLRAWHQTEYLMYEFTLQEVFGGTIHWNDGEPNYYDYHWNLDECEVMQWAGLQDKNKRDVYEGDAVRLYDERMPKEMREQIVSVTFENGCFMFGGFFPYGLEGQEVEVIGNIYEHPELLEARG